MKDLRFDTFEVNSANRGAFETCRDIAALQYQGARPVVLLGGEGTGKSHLLWAIVNEVRASKRRTGLALLLAQEFPAKVRDLVRAPAPIQQGRPAILLVDELERFDENAPDLEAVVRLFLDNAHQVVLASSVDPDRLAVFSPAFQRLLNQGQVIELRSRAAVLQEEPPNGNDALAELTYELEALRWERDELQKKLSETGAQDADADALKEELDASAAFGAREGELRRQLAEAQAEAEDALAEQARLQGLLSARKGLEETVREAEAERDKARENALRLAKRAEEILDQMQVRKTAFSGLQRGLMDKVTHFEEELAEAGGEQAPMRVPLEELQAQIGLLQQELHEARHTIKTRDQELEAFKRSAAAERASAERRAGKLQQRAAWLESALASAVEMGHAMEQDLQRFSEELERSADALRALAVRQAMVRNLAFEEQPTADDQECDERSLDADPVGSAAPDAPADEPSPAAPETDAPIEECTGTPDHEEPGGPEHVK